MTSKDAVLNIAVNLGRVARYIEENRLQRARVFLADNIQYISQVKTEGLNSNVRNGFERAIALGNDIQNKSSTHIADDFYTYANILTHRASLFE